MKEVPNSPPFQASHRKSGTAFACFSWPWGTSSCGMARSIAWWMLIVLMVLATTGCAGVAPYERGRLAHPSMTTSDMAGPSEAHVRAVQEGATGGGFEAGGGCGCN